MAAVVKIEEIHKIYDSGEIPVHAVRGVSLEIQRGEFVALMGASGSGKSTLMNLLGCLDRATRGRYLLDDTDVSQLSRNELADIRNQKIGFVFQGFNLLSRTTALENTELPMMYGKRRHSSREMRQRALHSLEIVGLSDRADHFPNQLSGGQRQRVAIARAFLKDAPLLVLDEATSALDAESEREVQHALDRLMELEGGRHRTTLVIAHRLSTIRNADRIVVLCDGQVRESGRHDELQERDGEYARLWRIFEGEEQVAAPAA
jgi:putative ABC transport system ATP-binding protein